MKTLKITIIMFLLSGIVAAHAASEQAPAEPLFKRLFGLKKAAAPADAQKASSMPVPQSDDSVPNASDLPYVKKNVAQSAGADAVSNAASEEIPRGSSFKQAADGMTKQLTQSMAELTSMREGIAKEKIPLSRKLSDLEGDLVKARLDYQQTTRALDSRTLDISNLRSEIKTRRDEADYLSNLLGEYIRNFESRLHIAEIQKYRSVLDEAKLAVENTNLSQQEIFASQAKLVEASIDRLTDALGGTRFEGKAVVHSGQVKPGAFVLVGSAALFKSDDGENVGTVEQRLGSLEPTIIEFETPADTKSAAALIADSKGIFPFDPTQGNAHKIEATKLTWSEHIKKGGHIMVPILLLGFAAFSVGLYKWFTMFTLRKPDSKRLKAMLDAVARHDNDAALQEAKRVGGPTGEMLTAAAEHLNAPRELIEEVMHEKVLTTKLRLQSLLPFIAMSATCAPLLGLLGTVTGIITTFSLITVFGSGDPKTLSGGISEALIGTEYGLYVAIPSLLMHAFLSRRARGVIDQMDKAGVAFINQMSKSSHDGKARAALSAAAGSAAPEGEQNGTKQWGR